MNRTNDRILVVDDDPIVCASVQIILGVDNYESDSATSGEQALFKDTQTRYSLVITDFSMPGMRGDELATRLRQRHPHTPAILLTGAPLREKITAIDTVLVKPCSPTILLQTVRKLLQEGARTRNPPLMKKVPSARSAVLNKFRTQCALLNWKSAGAVSA